jgi:putative copper resistance protein D
MSTADGLLVAARAVHFGAAIVLFGETLFALLASGYTEEVKPPTESVSVHRRLLRVGTWAWCAMAASGACWLALVSVQMSGRPLEEAASYSDLALVLGATTFGQAWSVRALLALVLAAMWPILQANPLPRGRRTWLASVVISGALLAGLAWSGHANIEVGVESWAHHVSDVAHLLAVGGWLGGLPALAALVGGLVQSPTARAVHECAKVTARFGNWAALCVGVIVVTGIVNTCYLLPDARALLETSYGNLLLLKVLVFSTMLAIAAVNRTRLTVSLRADSEDAAARLDAAGRLRRNVLMEQALGAIVIVLVAELGVTPPPMRM